MKKIDQAALLGHLPPHVRDKILKRVEVLKRYIRDKSRSNAEAGAAELGLSIVHFKKLVHVWELHGRADRLPGAEWPKTKSNATTAEQLAILKEASDAAPTATIEAAVRDAARLGTARGIRMPSRGSMRDRIMEMRQEATPAVLFGYGCHLVVVYGALDLPVEVDGVATMPIAALALHPGTRQVLGIGLSLNGPDPRATAAALREAAGRLPVSALPAATSGQIAIAMDVLPPSQWSELKDALEHAGADVVGENRPAPRRDLATAYLGRKVGGIEIRPRFVTKPATKRPPYIESGQGALSMAEALDFASKRMIPLVQPAASGRVIERLRDGITSWLGYSA